MGEFLTLAYFRGRELLEEAAGRECRAVVTVSS